MVSFNIFQVVKDLPRLSGYGSKLHQWAKYKMLSFSQVKGKCCRLDTIPRPFRNQARLEHSVALFCPAGWCSAWMAEQSHW